MLCLRHYLLRSSREKNRVREQKASLYTQPPSPTPGVGCSLLFCSEEGELSWLGNLYKVVSIKQPRESLPDKVYLAAFQLHKSQFKICCTEGNITVTHFSLKTDKDQLMHFYTAHISVSICAFLESSHFCVDISLLQFKYFIFMTDIKSTVMPLEVWDP